MGNDSVKPGESAAISEQRAAFEDLKATTQAEQKRTDPRRVGGVPRRAISEQEEGGRRADEVIPPARGKPE